MAVLDDLLAAQGRTRADLQAASARGPLAQYMKADGIAHTPELDRILALPRRPEITDEIVDTLSAALRQPHATVRLFPAQAEALLMILFRNGAFCPMRCGSGKTLVTLLAATLVGAERPVLIAPADLVKPKKDRTDKTRREFAQARNEGWRVRLPHLLSYEELGREDREGLIESLNPDLLLCDEAHRLRTRKGTYTSAMARRVFAGADHVRTNGGRISMLSGTMITDRVLDYWPALVASLGYGAPAPLTKLEAERWGQALDDDVGTLQRVSRGALEQLPGGYHEHLRGTAGVVSTPGQDCDATIEMRSWAPRSRPTLDNGTTLAQVIEYVQESGMRPDGELLEDLEIPNVIAQLALGFFFIWDPMPPEWWTMPRRAWLSFVRTTLHAEVPGLASEGQIKSAIDSGALRQGADRLHAWREVEDAFKPNSKPVWLTHDIVREAAAHAQIGDPCVVWTRYRPVGEALDQFGVPYYGSGTNPDQCDGTRSIACSIAAHATGKNLQAYHRGLVLTLPATSDGWEQLIARFHRAGQRADTVMIEPIDAVPYHGDVMERVLRLAGRDSEAAGEPQKIVRATWV